MHEGTGSKDIVGTITRLMRQHPEYDIELIREDFGRDYYVHDSVIYIHAAGIPSPICDLIDGAIREIEHLPAYPVRSDGRPRLVAINGGGQPAREPLRATRSR